MKRIEKQQATLFSFSYIDIFFLLLAGLILSVVIGFFAEYHQNNRVESYQVSLSSQMDETLRHAVPVAGDPVFGEDGEPYGRVIAVTIEELGVRQFLKIKCRLDGEKPMVGEELVIETPGSIRRMQVYSVESADSEKEGW
ncbi:MAG: hypothetical protein IJC26_08285 [Clostridia bacterium]|nr:hypothetical protein [Clostridia bacterium]